MTTESTRNVEICRKTTSKVLHTCKSDGHFLPIHQLPNHSIRTCNTRVKDCQKFLVEMGFVEEEIEVFQILL